MKPTAKTFKRLAALLFAVLLAATALLSVSFALAEIHHHCSGDHCPVCLNLFSLRSLLKEMALPLLLGMGASALFKPGQPLMAHGRQAACATPVSLGVRMND